MLNMHLEDNIQVELLMSDCSGTFALVKTMRVDYHSVWNSHKMLNFVRTGIYSAETTGQL